MARSSFSLTGAQTDQDVIAAVTGKSIVIDYIQFTTSSASSVALTDGADAAGTRLIFGDFAANTGLTLQSQGDIACRFPLFTLTAATALKATTAAGNLKGVVVYHTI